MNSVFVTGTDTGVGKTRISVGLIELLKQQGLRVAGMKPVASGCAVTDEGLRNEDAVALRSHANVDLPYERINPYAFEPAIAPHIAAQQLGVTIELSQIKHNYDVILQQVDAVVVEGAGGWLVPLNEQDTLAVLAVQLGLPVVLVVGIRLGCINHTLLTVDAIRQSGLPLYGWVANQLEENEQADAMIDTLEQRISAPCIGVVPPLTEQQTAEKFLKIGAQDA
ncbi:MAG: dethiobiotin synthase [Gammaproteobacteria bacterium]|nr:dethiobiotin synthase [Gammaproteobacteria bacterium]